MEQNKFDLELEELSIMLDLSAALLKYKYENESDEELIDSSMIFVRHRMDIIKREIKENFTIDIVKALEEKFNISIL